MSRFASNHQGAGNHGDVADRTEEIAGGEARVMRLLIDEIREAEPPELDWDKLEQSLMGRIAQERKGTLRPTRVGAAWGPLLGFAAAAAALIMLVAQSSSQHLSGPGEQAARSVDMSTLSPLSSQAGELPIYDAADVGIAALVQSGDEPLRFQVRGVATWVLEPHSQALVRASHAPYLIDLKQGALHAEVVPRKSNNEVLETFAVEVGGTRVAVHGTVFSVTRRGDDMSVEVTRGAVTVGPGGHRGITTGHLLVGPAHAAFSLDGGREAHLLPMTTEAVASGPHGGTSAPELAMRQRPDATPLAPAEPANPGAAETHGQPAVAAARPAGPAPALTMAHATPPTSSAAPAPADPPGDEPPPAGAADPPTLPAELPVLSASQAQALVVSCVSHAMRTSLAQDTVLMVSSQMSVNLDSAGKVLSARLNPPMEPKLQARCAGVLFGRKISGGPQIRFDVRVSRR